MQKIFSILTIILISGLSNTSHSQSMKIAAVVNDDVITVYDVQSRMNFMIFSSNSPKDQNSIKRIQNKAVRDLIDETLKVQEASRRNVSVADAKVNKEIQSIEQRNKLPVGGLSKVLAKNRTSIETLKERIHADLVWRRFVGRELRRKVRISEDQVDDELDIIASQSELGQKRVFEIFMPLESIEQEIETRATILDLRKQILSGTSFTSIARNFSKSSTNQIGGDRGWLSPGQLPEELDAIVQKLSPGELSEPVETLSGIYLFQVTDERKLTGNSGDTEFSFTQVTIPVPETGMDDATQSILNNAKASLNSCEAASIVTQEIIGAKVSKTDKIKLSALSDLVSGKIKNLKVGQTSEPIMLPKSAMFITICTRKDPKSNLPSRSDIRKQLLNAKLDILARQHLRDLRNTAFIDIRN